MSESAVVAAPRESPTRNEELLELRISDIELGKNVRDPDPELLKELAASIKEVGVLEPVLVHRIRAPEDPHPYELVTGYRRVAAAKKAGLVTVPARLLDVTDAEVPELQLTENLQREDMSSFDEARAFRAFIETTGKTQDDLARLIGKSRPYVSNRIRLLELPEPVKKLVTDGKISDSHAEVFLQLPKEATSTEVNDLVGRTVRDGESVKHLAERVRWKAGSIRSRVQRKSARDKALRDSKFPVCPVKGCGGKGQPDIDWNGKVGPTFSDRSGHTWSRKNGELIKSRGRGDSPRPREPPKPTLPLVDPNVPCPLTPDELWQAFYHDATLAIERFRVTTGGAKIRVDLSVTSTRSHPNMLPYFQLGRKPGFVEMDAGEWVQRTDADRKRVKSERETLERWLAGLAKKATRGKKGKG